MILSRRAALGGSQLDQVDSSVVIRGMDPGTTKKTVNTVSRYGGAGQRETGSHWETLEASVTYAIDIPKTNLADRREVFDDVNEWALNKGWLTMSWMDGKRLWVDDVTVPTSGDLFGWTDEFTIGFTARSVPFWQDAEATTATGNMITVPGMVETVCDAELVNGSGATVDTLTIRIGGSVFSFTSLGLAAGETLKIGHTEKGILFIRIYENTTTYRSAMDARTGDSSDDLTVKPGARLISVSAEGVTYTVSCCGRYL